MLVILIIFSNFVYAEEINIPETFTAETNINEVTTYYYAGDKLLVAENNNVITYHYQDRLGSDVNSKTLPFGQEIVSSERFSFTGKELDSELYYFNARYYDSDLGRFTSVDPVQDNHPYSYVNNNPMNYVDPSGMQPNNMFREEWHPPMAMEGEWYPYMASQKKPSYPEFIENIPTELGEVEKFVNSGEFGVKSIGLQKGGIHEIMLGEFKIFCIEQECADVALLASALYQSKYTNDVILPTNEYGNIKFSEWEETSKNTGFSSSFEGYLQYIFTYADTNLLMRKTEDTTVNELGPGDLIFNADSSHVRTIKRVDTLEDGSRIFTVFDGSRIVKNNIVNVRTVQLYQISENDVKRRIEKNIYVIKKGLDPNQVN